MGLGDFVKSVLQPLFPEVFSITVPIGGIDNLAIDANGILHDAREYFEGDTQRTERIMRQSIDITVDEYFKYVLSRLLEVLRECGPIESKLGKVKTNTGMMIAIDGVAPRAKLMQQRVRRFSSESSPVFDSNAITPYTFFMFKVHQKFVDLLNEPARRAGFPRNIIYSSYQVPGEGEQKIFMKLANNGLDSTHPTVVYGLDADLILMGLMSDAKRLYLMRQYTVGQSSSYHRRHGRPGKTHQTFLNISDLRSKIQTYLNGGPGKVLDFSIMALLFGNDFIPPIPGLTYYSEFSKVVKAYSEKGVSLFDMDNISISGLLAVLEALPIGELMETHVLLTKKRLDMDKNKKNPRDRKSYLANLPLERYRDHYYALVDTNPATIKDTILRMCVNWIQMLNWSYNYFRFYANAVSSVVAYEYPIAPMLQDVVEVLRVMISIPPIVGPGKIHPYAALLMILPYRSRDVQAEITDLFERQRDPYIIDEYLTHRNILFAPWQNWKVMNQLVARFPVTEGVEIDNSIQRRNTFNYKSDKKMIDSYLPSKQKHVETAVSKEMKPPASKEQNTRLRVVRELEL